MKRKIIQIDEEKCTGCGLCIPSCAEGALRIVDGKARVVADKYCDGLGACLGECPEGALTVVEREADEFDEHAVEEHLEKMRKNLEKKELPCGCPGASVRSFEPCQVSESNPERSRSEAKSELTHWPVQLTLVPPDAGFFSGRELVLAAQCAAFAYAGFHQDFLKNRAVVIACPKLDDYNAHLEKLAAILKRSGITKLIVANMEVPCCFGLRAMTEKAMELSGSKIPVQYMTVGVKGNIIS